MKNSFGAKVAAAAHQVAENIVPFHSLPARDTELPRINNMVCTTKLLHSDQLPLESFCMASGRAIQWVPIKFAANTNRLSDSQTDTTALTFRSGKMVLVRGIAEEHTRYMTHVYRLFMEQIECPIIDPDDPTKVVMGNLMGRLHFTGRTIYNVVGSGDLDRHIDLVALRNAAPHSCKYNPKQFPGLKFKMWIVPEQECVCNASPHAKRALKLVLKKRKRKKEEEEGEEAENVDETLQETAYTEPKCSCVVKVVLFDTGKVVIAGGRTVNSIYSSFRRIKQMVQPEQFAAFIRANAVKPKQDVFLAPLPPQQQQQQQQQPAASVKKRQKQAVSEKTALEALHQITETTHKKLATLASAANHHASSESSLLSSSAAPKVSDHDYTPFMRMCLNGQVSEVKTILFINPKKALEDKTKDGKTALDILTQDIPPNRLTTEHAQIIQTLREQVGKQK